MRILIVRLSALGDIVTSMACLQFIKNQYPKATIEWLVDQTFEEVLRYNPHIDQIHTVPFKKNRSHLLKLVGEFLKLKQKFTSYDLIIDMQGLIKSAIASRFIGKNIVGFDAKSVKEPLASLLYREKTKIGFAEHILKRNFALLQSSLNIDVSYSKVMHKEPYLFFAPSKLNFKELLQPKGPHVLLVLGGSWDSKIYPREKLLSVMQQMNNQALYLLWSNEEEHQRALWLQKQHPKAALLPKMSLNDLKALITKMDLVIGNDTGPTHMAWALNKASVTILGCTSKTRIPENSKNLTVCSDSEVDPCNINKRDLSIQEINPDDIVQAALTLL